MELIDVVRKLIGPVNPVGDTIIDEVRLVNLEAEIELVDKMISDIFDVANETDRQEYSRRMAGLEAKKFLKGLLETLKNDLRA